MSIYDWLQPSNWLSPILTRGDGTDTGSKAELSRNSSTIFCDLSTKPPLKSSSGISFNHDSSKILFISLGPMDPYGVRDIKTPIHQCRYIVCRDELKYQHPTFHETIPVYLFLLLYFFISKKMFFNGSSVVISTTMCLSFHFHNNHQQFSLTVQCTVALITNSPTTSPLCIHHWVGLYQCIVLFILMVICWSHRAMLVWCWQLKGGVCFMMCCQTIFFWKNLFLWVFFSLASETVERRT